MSLPVEIQRGWVSLHHPVERLQVFAPAELSTSLAEQHDFRGQLTDYTRLYAFLAQVLTFADADLDLHYLGSAVFDYF